MSITKYLNITCSHAKEPGQNRDESGQKVTGGLEEASSRLRLNPAYGPKNHMALYDRVMLETGKGM